MREKESRLLKAGEVLLMTVSLGGHFSVRYKNQVVSIFATMI